MKKKKVKANNKEHAKLINAIAIRLDIDDIEDIAKHGIAKGWKGFSWYNETVPFWRKYRKEIEQLINEYTIDGMYIMHEREDILRAYYGRYNSDFDGIYNSFTWHAVDYVCELIMDEK